MRIQSTMLSNSPKATMLGLSNDQSNAFEFQRAREEIDVLLQDVMVDYSKKSDNLDVKILNHLQWNDPNFKFTESTKFTHYKLKYGLNLQDSEFNAWSSDESLS